MRQLLVEGIAGAVPFIVNRATPFVFETQKDGSKSAKIPGRFSVCDSVNGNNRRYSKQVWEKNLKEGSILRQSIAGNKAFGLLEHPKDGIVTLLSPISHHVTEADLKQIPDGKGGMLNEVHGSIEILGTADGQKLAALIEGGYNPTVSSRGYGSLAKSADGVDDVCEDYVCEGWDVVIKPSFETCELAPLSTTTSKLAEPYRPDPRAESVPAHKEEKALAENKTPLKESPSTPDGTKQPASVSLTENKTMEITTLKSRVATLRSAVESCPSDPRRIESLNESLNDLGRDISQFRAADPAKNDWDAQKLNRDLDLMANKLGETATAPAKQAKKLVENNGKLMRVINAVASTASTYKKKLGEALKTVASNAKMIEELTRRGQAWQQLAESRKQKFQVLEGDFNTSCESLDLMAKRYHEDVTELGRRVIVLEFKEKAQTPEVQKLLKEATRLRHIAAIRETLEGKKPGAPVNEEGEKKKGLTQPKEGETATMVKKDGQGKGKDGDKVADAPGGVTNESASKGAEAATAPTAAAKIVLTERDPRGINESVEMVRRLSTPTAN